MSKNSNLRTGKLSSKDIERLVADTRAGALKPALHNHRSVPGLYLDLLKGTAWMFRFTSPEKRRPRDMGLGSIYLPSIGLMTGGLSPDVAWQKALELRQLVGAGIDPIEQEKRRKIEEGLAQATFRFCAESMIAANPADWTDKVIYQNKLLLKKYIYHIIGDEPIYGHLPKDVLRAIGPIWRTKNPRARQALVVMSRVYRWARANGYRDIDAINPCAWEYLADSLPPANRVHTVVHRTPMDYRLIPKFMAVLREYQHPPVIALRIAILSGSRIGEAIGMPFAELDLVGSIKALEAMPWLNIEDLDLDPDHNIPVWAIPPSRHKTGRETGLPVIRPLGPVSLEILRGRKQLHDQLLLTSRRTRLRPQYEKALAVLKAQPNLETVDLNRLAAEAGCSSETVKNVRKELMAAQPLPPSNPSAFVFPGLQRDRGDGPITNGAVEEILKRVIRPRHPEFGKFDTHGFRTSASNWARANGYDEELRKMMRGHVVGDEVQRTYERGQLLKERLRMQEAWENYCEGGTKDNVIGLSAARQRRAGE